MRIALTIIRKAVLMAVMLLTATFAIAQQSVSGVVTDINGNPLTGVTATIPGTTIGTATDAAGVYHITLPAATTTLVFSYMGYISESVAVNSRAKIDITLKEDALNMDEVVVVGYGALPKRSVTTAISTIKADNIKEMPVGTLGEALYGQLPGLYMVHANGQPGEAPSMRIRGTGSLTASSEPLFVIDGYPTNDATIFSNLSAESIESIQVLKDAASAAIYGSRAGNGVVLVTTKQGQKGTPTISVNITDGFQQPQRYIDVLDASEFAQMIKDARAFRGMSPLPLLDDKSQWKETFWQKEYFHTAPIQRYEVSARGATDRTNYSMSANYQDQDGIVQNSFYKRIGVRAMLESKLSKYVTAGINFNPTFTKQRRQSTSGGNTNNNAGTIADAIAYIPLYAPYVENGDYFQLQQHTKGTDFNSEMTNPLSKLLEINNDFTTWRTVSQAYITIKPIAGLTLKSEFNFSTVNTKNEYYRSPYAPGPSRMGNKSTPSLAAIDAYRMSSFNYDWYWSSTATYNRTFNKVHNLTAMLGYDLSYNSDYKVQQDDRTDSSYPIAYGNYSIQNVNGAYLWNGSSANSEYVFDAMFARVNYDYKSKYLISASVRRDRSSKFGPDNRAGMFWSTSAAYNISEEPWMKNIKWLSIAKIRASYGVTGNDRIGDNAYAWTSTMTPTNYIFGSGADQTVVTGYYPGGYSNRALGWEKNTQFDIGIDLGLFSKVTLNVDYYSRLSDAVLSVSIPNLNGKSSSVMMNAGEIRNRGIELSIGAPIFNKEFTWTANFNISFNRNKLLSLATGNDYYGSATGMVRNYVGRPLGDMYLYENIGTFNTLEEVKTLPKYNVQGLGDLRFRDVDDSGAIGTDDMAFQGNNMPKFNAGFTSRMTYKNIDFSFVLDGQYGGLMYWGFGYSAGLNRYMENSFAIYSRNRWRSESEPGDGISQVAGSPNVGTYLANQTRYLFKSDYLKIRNVSLGYTLPKSFSNKIGLKRLRVNASVQNLWSFDEYPGYSIEAGGMGGASGGSDGGTYPTVRTITFGLNFDF